MTLAAEDAEARLLAEIEAALDDTALTEAEYHDPEEFAAAVLNNLPAIAYALHAGMPVTKWRPAQKNPGEEQRVLRAVRQWSEQARRLILAYINGQFSQDAFVTRLMAAYQQQARNSFVAGRRAVGDLGPLSDTSTQTLLDQINSDAQRLQDAVTSPPAAAGGVGIGALLKSMFDPSQIFTPSNFLGSGLPGDPFAGLPPPLGAGGGHKKVEPPKVPGTGPATERFATTEPIAGPAGAAPLRPEVVAPDDRTIAQKAVGDYLGRIDRAGDQIRSYSHAGELAALTEKVPAEAVLSWWVLGAADHCIDCVRISAGSPYYASTLASNGLHPGSGHTRCGEKCQCHIEHDVPAEVCSDPMRGPGNLGAGSGAEDVTDLVESEDGRRVNVWVQEAASCRNPISIDSLARAGGATDYLTADEAYSWEDDMAGAITALAPVAFAALPAEIRNAFSFVNDIAPGGAAALQATEYRLDGVAYHALWQRSGGAVRFEVGATTAGMGVLDGEFTLRAIHDLTEIAQREGLRFEINGASRNAGLRRWLETLGAERQTIGAHIPTVRPAFDQMDALAERVLPHERLAYIGPTEPFDEMPEQVLLKPDGTAYDPMVGATPKALLTDQSGQDWLVKYMAPAGDPNGFARTLPEVVGTEVHEALGMHVVPVGSAEHAARAATAQKIVPGESLLKGSHTIHDLDAEGQRELARQGVVDWLIGNTDAHAGNFLVQPDGALVGIDKGLAYWNLARINGEGVHMKDVVHTTMWDLTQPPPRGIETFWHNVRPSDIEEAIGRVEAWDTDEYLKFVERVIPGLRAGSEDVIASKATPAQWRSFIRKQKEGVRSEVTEFYRVAAESATDLPADWQMFLRTHDFHERPRAGIAPGGRGMPSMPELTLYPITQAWREDDWHAKLDGPMLAWFKGLSNEDQRVILVYQSQAYTGLNRYLWTGSTRLEANERDALINFGFQERDLPRVAHRVSDLVDTAPPLPAEDGRQFRGTDASFLPDRTETVVWRGMGPEALHDLHVGDLVDTPAPMSTSVSTDVAVNYAAGKIPKSAYGSAPVVGRIALPEGTPVAWLGAMNMSAELRAEQEILLPAHMKFRVDRITHVTRPTDGLPVDVIDFVAVIEQPLAGIAPAVAPRIEDLVGTKAGAWKGLKPKLDREYVDGGVKWHTFAGSPDEFIAGLHYLTGKGRVKIDGAVWKAIDSPGVRKALVDLGATEGKDGALYLSSDVAKTLHQRIDDGLPLGEMPKPAAVAASSVPSTVTFPEPVWTSTDEMVADLAARYPGADFNDLALIDFEVASWAMHEMDNTFTRYGGIPSFRGVKVPKTHKQGVLAEVKRLDPNVPGSVVILPGNLWDSKSTVTKLWKNGLATPNWANSNTATSAEQYARAILSHELGHEYMGMHLYSRFGLKGDAIRTKVDGWFSEYQKTFKTKRLTDYSARNEHEAWAEAFAAAVGPIQSSDPRIVELRQILDEQYPASTVAKFGIEPEPPPLDLPAVIQPAPTFILPEVDALPAWPSMGLLKDTKTADLAGYNVKRILKDADGHEWLWKAEADPSIEPAAAALGQRLGLRLPPVERADWTVTGKGASKLPKTAAGAVAGTLQPLVPDAPTLSQHLRDLLGETVASRAAEADLLTEGQLRELWRGSILDFVVGNKDVHPGNFLIDKAGDLWAVDKGRSFSGMVIAQTRPDWFFADAYGFIMKPGEMGVFRRLKPEDFGQILNRLDGISESEMRAMTFDAMPAVANPFGTPDDSFAILRQRQTTARAAYERWFRDEIDAAAAADVSPEWAAWRKAGGTFEAAPVAPAGQATRLLPPPPDAIPTPAEMRSSKTFESRVGNDLGVLPAGFVPATSMPDALDRLSKALPKTTGNITGGFSVGQINAIVSRAETMADMGVDMGMIRRLGDFTLVPKADQARGIGLTYKGDRIALDHNYRWKFLNGVDSPDTVYNDIGGLFAHEYGHVAFAHLGAEQQSKVIALYKAHAEKAAADLSTYAGSDVEEWVGEVMAAITTPGYKPGTLAYDEEFWTALTADGAAKGVVKADKAPGVLKQQPPPEPLPHIHTVTAEERQAASEAIQAMTDKDELWDEAERSAFGKYKLHGSKGAGTRLQQMLRGDLPETPELLALRDDVDRAAAHTRASEQIVVYRGTDFIHDTVGEIFTEPTFLSATESPLIAAPYGATIYRMAIPTGSRFARPPYGLTEYEEILLPRGTSWKVEAVHDAVDLNGNGQMIRVVDVTPTAPIGAVAAKPPFKPAPIEQILRMEPGEDWRALVAKPDSDGLSIGEPNSYNSFSVFLQQTGNHVTMTGYSGEGPRELAATLHAITGKGALDVTVEHFFEQAPTLRKALISMGAQPIGDTGLRFSEGVSQRIHDAIAKGEALGVEGVKGPLPLPLLTSPIGPPISAPEKAWFKQGDAQQYLFPDNPLPLNTPAVQWSGFMPSEPALPSIATTKEAQAAAKAAHEVVLKDWHDVIDGKVDAAFTWDKAGADAAKNAGLIVEKIGSQYVTAKGPHGLAPLKAYIAGGGTGDDDAFWHLLGYSTKDLAAYDGYFAAKKSLRLTAGVVMAEPDGRMWLLAPRNKFAGYENTWIKGGVDAGETTAQAAVREMMEEAGFSVELDRYLGDYVNTDQTGVARMYVGHRTGGGPMFAHVKETYEVRLVDPAEAEEMLIRYGKPDARDQKILSDAVAALQGGPGIEQGVIALDDVGELAAKTAPEPVVWWPEAKPTSYSPASPKAGIAPEPPISTTFGFDPDVWKTFTPTEIPPVTGPKAFPYSQTRWTLADGQTQPMYWQVKPGYGNGSPQAAQLFWANSNKQLADPHMRLSLHVAQITKLSDVMAADATIDVLRVNEKLLDNVPGLRDILIAAGGQTIGGKYVEIGASEVHTLASAIKGNTPLGKAGLPGHIPTAALNPQPISIGSLGVDPGELGSMMSTATYQSAINPKAFNEITFGGIASTMGWSGGALDLDTLMPLYVLTGPGNGWVGPAQRDTLAVAMISHMAAVLKTLPEGDQSVIRLSRTSWGDLDDVAAKLGLDHPSENIWNVTAKQAEQIAAMAKGEMASAGFDPAFLAFSLPGSAVPPPPLTGLYKAGTVKRIGEATPIVDYSPMAYEANGTKIAWKMTGNPASPADETVWFVKQMSKGGEPLTATLGIMAQMGADKQAVYTLGFSKTVLTDTPGLEQILVAHGAVPVPGFALWMDEASSKSLLTTLTDGLPGPGTISPLAPQPIAALPTYAAHSVAQATAPTSAAAVDLLEGMTETKFTLGGVGPVTETTFKKGSAAWRRWSNTLELHELNGGPETLSAFVVRMAKAADLSDKIERLRILPGVILTDDAKAMLKAAGAVTYAGGIKIERTNLLALRDQIIQDAKSAASGPTSLAAPLGTPIVGDWLTSGPGLKWHVEAINADGTVDLLSPSGSLYANQNLTDQTFLGWTVNGQAIVPPAAAALPPPPAFVPTLLPKYSIDPVLAGSLTSQVTPLTWNFERVEWTAPGWATPIQIRHRVLKDTIVWDAVLGKADKIPQEQLAAAGVRHFGLLADRLSGDSLLLQIRFDNLDQMPDPFVAMLKEHGLYSTTTAKGATVSWMKREDVLALRGEIEPELGHAAVTATAAAIPAPPVLSWVEDLGVTHADVAALIAEPHDIEMLPGAVMQMKRTWTNGAQTVYSMQSPSVVRFNGAIASVGTSDARAAATIAQMHSLMESVINGTLTSVEVGPMVFADAMGAKLKDGLLTAGAVQDAAGLISIDKDAATAIRDAIASNGLIVPGVAPTGIPLAAIPTPTNTGASLAAQLGYSPADLANVAPNPFTSDDFTKNMPGSLAYDIPGASHGFFGGFMKVPSDNIVKIEFSPNTYLTAEQKTLGVLHAFVEIDAAVKTGAIEAEIHVVTIAADTLPQPITDMLAALGHHPMTNFGTDEYVLTTKEVGAIASQIDADLAVGKVVAGSATSVPPMQLPKDIWTIANVAPDAVTAEMIGPLVPSIGSAIKKTEYADLDITYHLGTPGAVWITASPADMMDSGQAAVKSIAVLHALAQGAHDAGSPFVIVAAAVHADPFFAPVSDVLKAYGAAVDGTTLKLSKTQYEELLADLSAGTPPPAVVAAVPLPSQAVPTLPATYGFSKAGVEALPAINVTPLKWDFYNLDWPGMGKGATAKYRMSTSTLTLVTGPKGALAPDLFISTLRHISDAVEASAVKTVRIQIDQIPTIEMRNLLTDIGMAVVSPDGLNLVISRTDMLALTKTIKDDLAGLATGALPAPAAGAFKIGDKVKITNALGGDEMTVTAINPNGSLALAYADGTPSVAGLDPSLVTKVTGPKPLAVGDIVTAPTGIDFEITAVFPSGNVSVKSLATGSVVPSHPGSVVDDIPSTSLTLKTPAAAAPTPQTIVPGDVVTNATVDYHVTAVNPNGTLELVTLSTGDVYHSVDPSLVTKKPGAIATPPPAAVAAPPAPPALWKKYGIEEDKLAAYQPGTSAAPGWGMTNPDSFNPYQKSYLLTYNDANVPIPTHPTYGYPVSQVLGAPSPKVFIRGKKHVARWTIDSVQYGTVEQQEAALYQHLHHMLNASAGGTPIFISDSLLTSHPNIAKLLTDGGGKAKTLAAMGPGIEIDKKTVTSLLAKFDASTGPGPLAQAIPATSANALIGQPVTAGSASALKIGDHVSKAGEVWQVTDVNMDTAYLNNTATGATMIKWKTDLPGEGWQHAAAPPVPTAAAVPAAPVVPAGAIGVPTALPQGVIGGPAIAPPSVTPSFLYGYDPAYVKATKPVEVAGVAHGSIGGDKTEMQLGGAKGWWSVSGSGSKSGLWDFEYTAGMTVDEARSAAFAMLRRVAEDGAARPKGFFIKPEFYDKVDGLRQMILDAGGTEASFPNLGVAVEMSTDAAKQLADALEADTMGPIKIGFGSTSQYLGFDGSTAKTMFAQAPVINGRTGEFTWDAGGTKVKVIATTNADKTEGTILKVSGDTVTNPLAVVAQINWLADLDASSIIVSKEVLDAVPGLRQWLLTAGGKVDGGVIRLDETAVGNASKILVKDALPVGLGGPLLPYSPFDDMRADVETVAEALGSHVIDTTKPVNTSAFTVGGQEISTRWTKSSTNIHWDDLERGTAGASNARAAAAAQLRVFANTVGETVSIERLDISTKVLATQPGLRAALLKYGATEIPAGSGQDAYLSLTRAQTLKMRKDIEGEFDLYTATLTPETYAEGQAMVINWPTADDLAYDKKASVKIATSKTTAGSVSALDKLAIYTDATGAEWLFKPGKSGRGAMTDRAVADLARRLGLPVPPTKVYTLNFNGAPTLGSLQKMLPGAKSVASIADLDNVQTEDMLRHSVLDWVTNNDDGHAGNWLIAPDGHLWAIDKSRSYLGLHGASDVLANSNRGNGYPALIFDFFNGARHDPAMLAKIHPQTITSTLRSLAKISDEEFRNIMRPVAQATTDSRYVGKVDKMLNEMVERKNSAAADFERYFSGEIDAAIKAAPSKVPDEWKVWHKAGGKFNLNATPEDLWKEDLNVLNAKYGDFSATAYNHVIQTGQFSKAAAVMDQYIDGGLRQWSGGAGSGLNVGGHGYVAGNQGFKVSAADAARLKGVQGEGTYAPNLLPFLAPPDQYQQWLEVQRWATLNIVNGKAGPRSATYDNLLRQMWDPKTGTIAIGRGSSRFSSPGAQYADYQKYGSKSVKSYAVPGHEWPGIKTFAVVNYSQIITSVATDVIRQEYEFLTRDIRLDQLVRMTNGQTMSVAQVRAYTGPVA